MQWLLAFYLVHIIYILYTCLLQDKFNGKYWLLLLKEFICILKESSYNCYERLSFKSLTYNTEYPICIKK